MATRYQVWEEHIDFRPGVDQDRRRWTICRDGEHGSCARLVHDLAREREAGGLPVTLSHWNIVWRDAKGQLKEVRVRAQHGTQMGRAQGIFE